MNNNTSPPSPSTIGPSISLSSHLATINSLRIDMVRLLFNKSIDNPVSRGQTPRYIRGEDILQRECVMIDRDFARYLEGVEGYTVQWKDFDGNELPYPYIWENSAWKSDYGRQMQIKRASEARRQAIYKKEEKKRESIAAIAKMMNTSVEVAESIAEGLWATKNWAGLMAFGVEVEE